jgi:8-oxo-dGTP pyrophosphatase MutT (NUDIX family)
VRVDESPSSIPHGAAVVVFRRIFDRIEYLLLHRAWRGRDYQGDWAWGSPGGTREAWEDAASCAHRELLEETGLDLYCRPVPVGSETVALFVAEAPHTAEVVLSHEHDAYLWVDARTAVAKCLPKEVSADLLQIIRMVETE